MREQAIEVCKQLKKFYLGLDEYYSAFGLDIESNRGRRNILMSEPMELFLARELGKTLDNVVADGRTGAADITFGLGENLKEIECKLTSPHMSSGSICFQTDYETLEKKGSIDYVYLIADEAFEKFCFIFFKGLTLDDFRALSPGSRGKVQMYKHRGMKKATVLLGQSINRNNTYIDKLEALVNDEKEKFVAKKEFIEKTVLSLKSNQLYEKSKKISQLETAKKVFIEKLNNVNNKIIIKREAKASYSFTYEDPNEIT